MDIVFILVGALLVAIISFLIGRSFSKPGGISKEELELKFTSKERFADLQVFLQQSSLDKNLAETKLSEANITIATWQQRYSGLEQKLNEQKTELEQLQERFKNDFKVLAQEILEKNSATFKEQNKEQIGSILSPFKEKLEAFEKKVEETYEKGKAETISLKTEVRLLSEQSAKLAKDADNLTRALKGEVKTQGNWGEVILERILEKSGLTKDSEYFVQQNLTTEDGKRFQPDVILKLPDDKNIIIDAKVTLVAYERYVSSEDVEEQKNALKQHILALKNHVKELSEKKYQSLYGIDGLDFVLLFVPIEGAFSAAIQSDQNLFQDAFDKNVVIVSTSTLLATLRTIASIWKQEKQTQNALEIARQGGDLYDKFVTFSEDLINLGKQMNTAKSTYDGAMNKLAEGRGNLINRAEKLRALGVKATKQLDQRLLNNSGKELEP